MSHMDKAFAHQFGEAIEMLRKVRLGSTCCSTTPTVEGEGAHWRALVRSGGWVHPANGFKAALISSM
jgi:hypothetical protein